MRVDGRQRARRPGLLKTSVGCRDRYIGEGQISYAGPTRSRAAGSRWRSSRGGWSWPAWPPTEIRCDLIGIDSLHGEARTRDGDPYEVRIAWSAERTASPRRSRIGNEVETLYTNGPAAGGGVWKSARQVIAVASALVPETRSAPP